MATEQELALEALTSAVRAQMGGVAVDVTIYTWKDDARDGDARITFSIAATQRDFAKNLAVWNRKNGRLFFVLEPEVEVNLP